jgi:hypothetical protein
VPRVVVLEDSQYRIDAIRRTLGANCTLELFTTAPAFSAWLPSAADDLVLITLDHHLGPPSAGSGMDAARALAALPAPLCPVILHSSDAVGARAQQQALAAAGWHTERFPFSEPVWAAAFARLVQP